MRLIVGIQGVAAQLCVAGDLHRREQVNHRKVISQMRATQRALRGTDPRSCVIQCFLRHNPLGEVTIERCLFGEDSLADRDRLALHRLQQLTGPGSLLRRKLEGICEFEHMHRSRITV